MLLIELRFVLGSSRALSLLVYRNAVLCEQIDMAQVRKLAFDGVPDVRRSRTTMAPSI